MTEHHKYVDADAEKLTDGEFVQHVAHQDHPAHPHGDAGSAAENTTDQEQAPAQEPQQ
jgi:hypothetical protein